MLNILIDVLCDTNPVALIFAGCFIAAALGTVATLIVASVAEVACRKAYRRRMCARRAVIYRTSFYR